jgi:ribosomal protein S18 acetylase RimI-like enzyme
MMEKITVSLMQASDFDAAVAVWSQAEGVCLCESDTRDGIAGFLLRNPDSSFVASSDGRLVGAVLCGHDGRRGHIYHLGVDPSVRRQGVGTALLSRCMLALADAGIPVCRTSVLSDNVQAQDFWNAVGWVEREELKLFTGLTERGTGGHGTG